MTRVIWRSMYYCALYCVCNVWTSLFYPCIDVRTRNRLHVYDFLCGFVWTDVWSVRVAREGRIGISWTLICISKRMWSMYIRIRSRLCYLYVHVRIFICKCTYCEMNERALCCFASKYLLCRTYVRTCMYHVCVCMYTYTNAWMCMHIYVRTSVHGNCNVQNFTPPQQN